MEGDPEESEEEEVTELGSGDRSELPAGTDHDPEDHDADGEAGPYERDRREVAKGDLGRDEGGAPGRDREHGLDVPQRVGRGPTLGDSHLPRYTRIDLLRQAGT